MANVRFIETTKTAYDAIKSDDSAIDLSAIYFLTDTGQIYKGRTLMTDQEVVEGLNNKEDLAFKGTLEEWNELTTEEKNAYNTAFVSEDVGSGISITDNVESGNLNPVTSNAVYEEINKIRNTQIVIGTSRTVSVLRNTAQRWSANLPLPTIPEGKKVLRWFAVVRSQATDTNGCATIGYMGSSGMNGIPNSIITVPDNDGTMEIAFAAEIF